MLIAHETQLAEHQDQVKLLKYTQEILFSDQDGWIPPELDFDKLRAQEKEVFEVYLRRKSPDRSEGDAKKLWLYNERRHEYNSDSWGRLYNMHAQVRLINAPLHCHSLSTR